MSTRAYWSWWVCVPLFLGACRAVPPLLDERVVPPFAQILAEGQAWQRTPEDVRVEDPGAAPLTMRVTQVHGGAARPGPLLVLVPGVLAAHDSWRFLTPLLAARHDLLLLDPIGAGKSDIPDPDRHPPPAYTPGWLGRHALRAVERWQAQRNDTREVVLVGHSLGSASLLRSLSDPTTRSQVPRVTTRISHLVLIAPPDVLTREPSPTLEKVAQTDDAIFRIGTTLGVLADQVEQGIYESVVDPSRHALRGEATRLTGILADDRTRRAAQAMLRRWRPMTINGRPLPDAVKALARRESNVRWPTLVIWGTHDTTLPPSMAPIVTKRIPGARLAWVANARHSVHQEQARVCAALIVRFLIEPTR